MTRQLEQAVEIMEILEVGGRLYAPPEDEARVLVPQLMKVINPDLTRKDIEVEIRRLFGSILEVEGRNFINDTGKRMAQRGERSAGSDGGACTGGIESAAAAN
jgi:hypothetical protein